MGDVEPDISVLVLYPDFFLEEHRKALLRYIAVKNGSAPQISTKMHSYLQSQKKDIWKVTQQCLDGIQMKNDSRECSPWNDCCWKGPLEVSNLPDPSAHWGQPSPCQGRRFQSLSRPLSGVLPPSQWAFVSNHFIQISLAATFKWCLLSGSFLSAENHNSITLSSIILLTRMKHPSSFSRELKHFIYKKIIKLKQTWCFWFKKTVTKNSNV